MEWTNIKDELPDGSSETYIVKKENGEEKKVFFMSDGMNWISFYGIKPSFWMDVHSGELIYDVTHWKS